LDFLKTVIPVDPNTGDIPFIQKDGLAYDTASFLYEATILAGLSLCHNVSEDTLGNLSGTEYYNKMVHTSFSGITGKVILNQTTGTRLSDTVSYFVVNYEETLANKSQVDGRKTFRFEPTWTHYYPSSTFSQLDWNSSNTNNTSWLSKYSLTVSDLTTRDLTIIVSCFYPELDDYIFNDGTTNMPMGIPNVQMSVDYVNQGVRILATILFALVTITALMFASWTHCYRKERVVSASQPVFLYIICAGCIILGTYSKGLSNDGCQTCFRSEFLLPHFVYFH
jgi:hypothetical protein